MKEPDHPVKPAFDKATDELAAWRAQQNALLKEKEREHYDHLLQEAKKKKEQKEKELKATQVQRIQEEKQRQLLVKRNFVLEMIRSKGVSDRQAEKAAKRIIHTQDLTTLQTIAAQTMKSGDQFLKDKEQERKKEKLRQTFQRAAQQKRQSRERDQGGRER